MAPSGATSPPIRRPGCIPPEALDDFLATRPPLESSDPSRRDQRDHGHRRRPRLGHQCRAAAAPVALVRGARRAASSTPPPPPPTATERPDSRTTRARRRWPGCARSICTAGPSTPSTSGWRALLAGGAPRPPQWAGLKFFNVYGPNEYHKGSMISVVKVKYDEVAAGRPPRLFRSDRADLADGAQTRDFIWVGDVVDVMLWLLDNAGGERAVQRRHRPGAQLSRSRACGVRRRRRAAAGGVHRHARKTARPVPVLHRGARPRGCAPPASPASSPRSRKASAATCRTT